MATSRIGECKRERERERRESESEARMKKKKGVSHVLTFWINITNGLFHQ